CPTNRVRYTPGHRSWRITGVIHVPRRWQRHGRPHRWRNPH
ncbi:MAG: hypothetical protein AVDCRST_MAG70-2377, partial [uncultured Thermomicrobiales bacterium]